MCSFVDFSLSGFCDAFAFKNLNDIDIEAIENYMRQKALDAVATELSKSIDDTCDVLLDNQQMIEIFGETYAACPEQFQFLPGQKSLIYALVSHVKKMVDAGGENMGLSQFNCKKKRNKKKHADLLLTVNRLANYKNDCRKSAKIKPTNSQLTQQLFHRLQICLQSFGVDITGISKKSVEVDQSGKYGIIHCILCDDSEDQQPKRVYYHSGPRSCYWVVSNFEKHLKKVHSLKIKRSKSKSKRTKHEEECDVESELHADHKNVLAHDVMDVSLIESPVKHRKRKSIKHSVLSSESESKDDSVLFLGVVPKKSSTQTTENIETLICTQISLQIQQMVAAILIHGETEVSMEFFLNNQTRYLSVVQTSPDGNCLYSALAHQLWPNQITSPEHLQNIKKLRSIVVEHILKPENFHLYETMLHDRLSQKKTESAASLTAECKLFVRHALSRQGIWGGLETIKAVSNEYHVNVVVFNERKSCNMITGSDEYKHTLVIAYRGQNNTNGDYNHYDSVSDMQSADIFAAADFIINKHSQK